MNGVGEARKRSRLVLRALTFLVLLAIGLAIRGWAVLQWETNVDSDEAIFGLMALHIGKGEYVPTVYGTQHLGSIESYTAALFIKGLGFHVVAFRAGSYLFLASFLLAHAWYVSRTWSSSAALVSLTFAAVPGFHILSWTYQPLGAYAALLLIGTLILIISESRAPTMEGSARSHALLGFLTGVGLWGNQMMVVYLIAAVFPILLTSHEWIRLRHRLSQSISSRLGLEPLELFPSMALAVGALCLVAFFSSGCSPPWQFERLASLARVMVATVFGAVGLGMFIVSERRRAIARNIGVGTVGFGLGFFPLWYGWVTGYQEPISSIRPSCPTGIVSRIQLLVEEILPELLGVRAIGELRTIGVGQQIASMVVVILTILAVLWFSWHYRQSLWSLVSLRANTKSDRHRGLTLGLLFITPLFLAVVGANTVDIHSIRYLLVAWQALTILLGLFATRLIQLPWALRVTVLVGWVGFIGISNIAYAKSQWPVKYTRFDQAAMEELESYLEEERVTAGFADYWGAFVFDFLTEERLVFAPYNGLDRIPGYTEKARTAERIAFVFPSKQRPTAGEGIEELRDWLERENRVSGEGPTFGWIIESLVRYEVESRRTVAHWDVWILAANTASSEASTP